MASSWPPTSRAASATSDAQLLSLFSGPAASFIRSRQIYDRERVERTSAGAARPYLVGELGSMVDAHVADRLLHRAVQSDLGYERIAFYATDECGRAAAEAEARAQGPLPPAGGRGAARPGRLRGSRPLPSATGISSRARGAGAGGRAALGVLEFVCAPGSTFSDDDANLL